MIKLENLSSSTLEALRGKIGLAWDDPSKDEEIKALDPREAMKMIIGWKLGDESWLDVFEYAAKQLGYDFKG
jgi:hypothetical protein